MKDRKIAKITEKNYLIRWNTFVQWCEKKKYSYMPTSYKIIAEFMEHKCKCTSESLCATLVSIRFIHSKNSMQVKGDSKDCTDVINRRKILSEQKGHRQKNNKIITIDLLKSTVQNIPNTLLGLRDKAMILLKFFSGLCNINEIESKHLEFYDSFILIRDANQSTGGMVLRRNLSQELCPVKALEEWIDAAKITDGYLLRNIRGGRSIRKLHGPYSAEKMSSNTLSALIKKHFGDGFSCASMDKEEVTGIFC